MFNYNTFLLFEKLDGKIILYRGDLQYIETFDSTKFRNTAIFGTGLYLTDNKQVAYSYTLKGSDKSAVVADFYTDYNKQKNAEFYFIINYLLNDINGTNFSETELYDLSKDLYYYEYGGGLNTLKRYKEHGILQSWYSDEYISKLSDEEKEKEIEELELTFNCRKNLNETIEKLKAYHLKFDRYIKNATDYFNKNRWKWIFQFNSQTDDENSWVVIEKSKNVGHVSKFEVDRSVISKLYNANSNISDDIKLIIKKCIKKHLRSEKMVKYFIDRPFLNDRYWKNSEIFKNNDTLAKVLYNNYIFRDKETCFEKDIWDLFISEMKKLGYLGIKYNGGDFLQSPIKHNAYVIWDINNVKRFINEGVGDMITKLNIFESITNLDYEYKFDNSKLRTFINSARKWNEKDFVEEYVYLNDIETVGVYNNINKGEEILLGREVKDSDGKNVYNVTQVYSPYKKVKADKYYSNVWQFILDNTKELQEEGRILYNLNKGIKKPKFSKNEKTIRGYHASSHKFDEFRYNTGNNSSGQLGADSGFFFFKDIKNAKYYASVLKENNGIGYIYECDIKLGEVLQVNGEDVGTNWGRIGFFEQAKNEGYDVVIIADADTGYGITDEIVVFDDDNINILNIISI